MVSHVVDSVENTAIRMDCEGGGSFAGDDLLKRPVEIINLEDVDLVVAASDIR